MENRMNQKDKEAVKELVLKVTRDSSMSSLETIKDIIDIRLKSLLKLRNNALANAVISELNELKSDINHLIIITLKGN